MVILLRNLENLCRNLLLYDRNSAAHVLANEVSNNNVDLCWLEETFVEC
jgi:hypothetical protein